ncbi:hypothetical protein VNO78_02073 [Psophocarpus tetragonolobus]|uniref:Reverse transcriptase domain-containing protein n=1 Tax=Psophocarpus tetragonolobus TaxID=3891 RepID=A0AAN9T270_PSOTE
MDLVKEFWPAEQGQGWKMYKLARKLKGLKLKIKYWKQEYWRRDGNVMDEKVLQLETLDHQLGQGVIDSGHQRQEILSEYWEKARRMERSLLQKSRVRWALYGDRNTKFFHKCFKERCYTNSLLAVKSESGWVEGVQSIRDHVFHHFKTCSKDEDPMRPKLDGVTFTQLTDQQRVTLEEPFSAEEIKEAVWACDGGKSPGPDGFGFQFYKSCWEIIGGDVVSAVQEFHQSGVLPRGVTSAFLTLIPKVPRPDRLAQFRPISLISSIQKIVSKLLSLRMKKVMGHLISKFQSTFLTGRSILDGALVANEIVDWAKRKRRPCFLLKVDFQKAYDSFNWDFLDYMLARMGFGNLWRKSAVGKAVFKELNMGAGANFSVLQYADDVIMMEEADLKSIWYLKVILRGFELTSGLKVNYSKSQFFGLNVQNSFTRAVSNLLNCIVSTPPFKFLGIPVGVNPRKVETWKPILEQFQRKLAAWRAQHMSFAGRPKEEGSLGVKCLRTFNLSLLAKWRWRILNEQNAVWTTLLECKYGPTYKFNQRQPNLPKASQWWRDLWAMDGPEATRPNWFSDNVFKKVGDGKETLFWEQKWIGDTSLSLQFPRLYGLAADKGTTVFDKREVSGGWVWEWRRQLFVWETEQLRLLQSRLQQVTLVDSISDRWRWKTGTDGVFSVVEAYLVLRPHQPTHRLIEVEPRDLRRMWKDRLPSKVIAFSWRLLSDRVPTMANLLKRGIQIPGEETFCVFCHNVVEDRNHMFLGCAKAQYIWNNVISWLGIQGPLPGDVSHLFLSLAAWVVGKRKKQCRYVFWLAGVWSIWITRNQIIFDKLPANSIDIVMSIKDMGE